MSNAAKRVERVLVALVVLGVAACADDPGARQAGGLTGQLPEVTLTVGGAPAGSVTPTSDPRSVMDVLR